MNFASEFALLRQLSSESLSEDEFDDGLLAHAAREAARLQNEEGVDLGTPEAEAGGDFPDILNDDDDYDYDDDDDILPMAQLAQQAQTRRVRANKRQTGHRKVKKVDTNIISLALGTLVEGVTPATGDPVYCTSCRGVLSIHSVLVDNGEAGTSTADAADGGDDDDDDSKTWTCEFCGTINDSVELEPEEIPTAESVDYIVEVPGPSQANDHAHAVVFVIDTSGSMCVTTEVAGKVKLKGGDKLEKDAAALAQFTEGTNQFMHGQNRNVTYISRLQAVQAAVSTQIDRLAVESPNVKVGLVTFASDCTLYGDGDGAEEVIAGDKLSDYNRLLEEGQTKGVLIRTVEETREALNEKIFALDTDGATALGPAIVSAVASVSNLPGSKVVICTDGLANIGVGSMEEMETDEQREGVEAFYTQIAAHARTRGVSISTISIEGTDTNVEFLGILSDTTQGEVEILNPLELTKNFGSIMAEPVIATGVTVTMLMHQGLSFSEENEGNVVENRLENEIGNVTASTDVTFNYRVNPSAEVAAGTELPFQVQIHYTRVLDGVKLVRVITNKRKTTADRATAEEAANIDVVALNNIHTVARLAKNGEYTKAREVAYAGTHMMNRQAYKSKKGQRAYSHYVEEAERLDNVIRNAQHAEWDDGLYLSDSDGDDDDLPTSTTASGAPPRKGFFMKKKMAARSRARNDATSKAVYQAKNMKMKGLKRAKGRKVKASGGVAPQNLAQARSILSNRSSRRRRSSIGSSSYSGDLS